MTYLPHESKKALPHGSASSIKSHKNFRIIPKQGPYRSSDAFRRYSCRSSKCSG